MADPFAQSGHEFNPSEKKAKNISDKTVHSKERTFLGLIRQWLGFEEKSIAAPYFAISSKYHPIDKTSHAKTKLSEHSIKEVVRVKAVSQKVIQDLIETKEKLLKEFGALGSLFVKRAIDPIVEEMEILVQDLTMDTEAMIDLDWLNQAVSSVKFFSQFSEEKQVLTKISEQVIFAVEQAIEKDIQLIAHYQSHTLDGNEPLHLSYSVHEKGFGEKMRDLMKELESLKKEIPATDSLREMFLWKTSVDDKRASLTELALLTIDAFVGQAQQIPWARRVIDEEERDLDDEIERANSNRLEHSMTMEKRVVFSHLSYLEERALEIFDIIDHAPVLDAKIVQYVFEMIEEVKTKATYFLAEEANTKELKEAISGVLRVVHQAEESLRKRRFSSEISETDFHHK